MMADEFRDDPGLKILGIRLKFNKSTKLLMTADCHRFRQREIDKIRGALSGQRNRRSLKSLYGEILWEVDR